jgi:hypothetical protein
MLAVSHWHSIGFRTPRLHDGGEMCLPPTTQHRSFFDMGGFEPDLAEVVRISARIGELDGWTPYFYRMSLFHLLKILLMPD